MGSPNLLTKTHVCLIKLAKIICSKVIDVVIRVTRDNQNKTTSALPCLIELMGSLDDIHLSRLACYCVSCIVCNNYAMMHYVKGVPKRSSLIG